MNYNQWIWWYGYGPNQVLRRRLVLIIDVANYAFIFSGLYEISGVFADESASADADYEQMEKGIIIFTMFIPCVKSSS